jgi:hypothetical protein
MYYTNLQYVICGIKICWKLNVVGKNNKSVIFTETIKCHTNTKQIRGWLNHPIAIRNGLVTPSICFCLFVIFFFGHLELAKLPLDMMSP